LARLRAARAHARARAWAAGAHPDVELLIIDADATLVLAHSDAKQGAAGTYKHSFGFHPLLAYLDRGKAPGEPLAGILRPGNASAGGAGDLIELVDLALAQLPGSASDQPVLVRSDSAGASTQLARHLRDQGVGFSVAMPIDAHVREAILGQPKAAWTPAVDADGQPRDGADVCELTGWIDLHTWPEGTRVICRREDAHPGAQLRFTDHDGHRFQVFLTDQPDGDLARLELRHRQRARVEDRIRGAKATGLANLPFDRWRRNAVWLELVLAAQDLTVWAQTLLLDGALAVAEPKTLRYRLWHVAARIVRHARRRILRLQRSWPGRSNSPGVHTAAGVATALLTAHNPAHGHHLAASRAGPHGRLHVRPGHQHADLANNPIIGHRSSATPSTARRNAAAQPDRRPQHLTSPTHEKPRLARLLGAAAAPDLLGKPPASGIVRRRCRERTTGSV
jgi:hypothetical protein